MDAAGGPRGQHLNNNDREVVTEEEVKGNKHTYTIYAVDEKGIRCSSIWTLENPKPEYLVTVQMQLAQTNLVDNFIKSSSQFSRGGHRNDVTGSGGGAGKPVDKKPFNPDFFHADLEKEGDPRVIRAGNYNPEHFQEGLDNKMHSSYAGGGGGGGGGGASKTESKGVDELGGVGAITKSERYKTLSLTKSH